MFKQLATGLVWSVLLALQGAHAQASVDMVSLTNGGGPPTFTPSNPIHQAAVTPDGRYVVFEGSYTGLVISPNGPTNNMQIYLRDRLLGTTELISQSTAGIPANQNNASEPTISNDGCRVVFVSYATNLIDNTTTGSSHIFLRDRCIAGVVTPNKTTTTMVDVMPNGNLATDQAFSARISGDGRTVALNSYSMLVDGVTHAGQTCRGYSIVYLRDLENRTTTALKRPDGGCISGNYPDISYDGTRIAFWSGDDLLNKSVDVWQMYLFDTSIGPTSLAIVSADAAGTPQRQKDPRYGGEDVSSPFRPAISQDGRIVAFESRGFGLWPNPPVSGGSVVAQIYVKDTYTGAIDVASVDSATVPVLGNLASGGARPGLSSDGQYIVFRTTATNITTATSGFVLHNNFYGGTVGLTDVVTLGFADISSSGRFVTVYSNNAMDPRFTKGGMFLMDLGIPYAPTITKLTPMGTKMKVDFTTSAIFGAIALTNFGALCEGSDGSSGSTSGTTSPLTIAGLKPGVTYICSVLASNANGKSAFSSMVTKKLNVDLTPILMLLLD